MNLDKMTIKLRQAIADYLSFRFNLNYTAEETIVTVGASEAIDLSLRAIVSYGDEVLIPEPSYVSYAPCVILAGGKPIAVECSAENSFKLTLDALKTKISEKTKALILPYPNNPTGAIMEENDLKPIAEYLKNTAIITISDEIYAELTYGKRHCSIASFPEMKERVILINGFSKAFAMTGWRLGYVCAVKELIKPMLKIHQYTIMCAPTASQYAGLEALVSGIQDDFSAVEKMRSQYDLRRRFLHSSLNEMGLNCFNPEGAFYVFPCVKSTGMDGETFAEKLLKEQKTAVVPGSAFGSCGKNFIRISYAYSLKKLEEAIGRIQAFLK
ncbi:aminotransferase class I/II-fold pyridoxal phosphate-dependent enzyme [bacterium]|nr:aminotransferase class I/II-fold pyridoxal phosphate-dependent enzyme [bacterium]